MIKIVSAFVSTSTTLQCSSRLALWVCKYNFNEGLPFVFTFPFISQLGMRLLFSSMTIYEAKRSIFVKVRLQAKKCDTKFNSLQCRKIKKFFSAYFVRPVKLLEKGLFMKLTRHGFEVFSKMCPKNIKNATIK